MKLLKLIFFDYILEPVLLISAAILVPLISLALRFVFVILSILSGRVFKKTRKIDSKCSSVLITGASSGLGEAIALEFCQRHRKALESKEIASPENLKLFLSGRNKERLYGVKKSCESIHSSIQVFPKVVDVTDKIAMRDWITNEVPKSCDSLDVVIANAGISEYQLIDSNPDISVDELACEMIECHIHGVTHTIFPAIEVFKQQNKSEASRKNRYLSIVGSGVSHMSKLLGPYALAKQFQSDFVSNMRPKMEEHQIVMSVIILGWIQSRMADAYPGNKPMITQATDAAKTVIDQMLQGESHIVVPDTWAMNLFSSICRMLTSWVSPHILVPINQMMHPHVTKSLEDKRKIVTNKKNQ